MSVAANADRRALVVANWKLHGNVDFNAALLTPLRERLKEFAGAVDVVVCPPFVYLPQVHGLLRGGAVSLGAQDVSDREQGAYTGENSAAMLKDVGCRYVIVGHSERRSLYHEDDALVSRKFAAALKAGLVPVLCVGETLEQREAGEAERLVCTQLDAVAGVSADAQWAVAYEPVWAIGTGRTASVGQVAEMHAIIRARLEERFGSAQSVRVVYGGSVKADNARALFQTDGVDGGLIGGASLDGESFYRICAAAIA